MKFILDANVVVSALISRSADAAPRVLLDALVDDRYVSLVSPELIAEWREVLFRPKVQRYHRLQPKDVLAVVDGIERLSEIRRPPPATLASPDPEDDHLWALLESDRDAILVTGDQLLVDSPIAPGRVITPREAVNRLDEARSSAGRRALEDI